MFMETEKTPNPSALKFIPGPKLADTPIDFPSAETTEGAPLAQKIFQVPGVTSIFIAQDFITITKADDKTWEELTPALSSLILNYLASGKPIFTESYTTSMLTPEHESDEGVVKDIKDILNTRVRPAVARDGGDIIFDKFDNGVVYLRLKGACSGCPSSTLTLKSGIENMLRYYVPEVIEVRAVDE